MIISFVDDIQIKIEPGVFVPESFVWQAGYAVLWKLDTLYQSNL